MRRTIRWTAGGLLLCVVTLPACGSSSTTTPARGTGTTVAGAVDSNSKENLPPGDIPDNQVFVPFSPAAGTYALKYPEGWSQRQSGGVTIFSQYFNTIEVAATKAREEPTTVSARSKDVAKLRSVPGFKLIGIDTVTRSAGKATRIDPVTGKRVTLEVERYLFWHRGALVTITLSSPKGSDNVDPWKTVTDSLAWE
jgi:hypothetical protein